MRRRYNRRRRNNQRKIIILSIIGLLWIMVVGYSAFQTNLNINVKGNVKGLNAADQLKKTVVDSGDGLYASAYEEGRYIYRGADPDNYITFNDETWRIMSVESDGTLKIRRASSIGSLAWDTTYNRDSSTSTYCTYASSDGCNAWSTTASMIGSPSNFIQYYPNGNTSDSTAYSGTVISDSTINAYLNGTYYNTLSDVAQSYVVEGIFDVSTPGDDSDTEDMATNIQQAKQYQWKGKVALMTILEWMQTTSNTTCTSLNIAYNSASTGYCSDNNWMSSASEWSLSPKGGKYSSQVWLSYVCYLYASSCAFMPSASSANLVRPVLYLRSNITLSGQGTSSNPYTINS